MVTTSHHDEGKMNVVRQPPEPGDKYDLENTYAAKVTIEFGSAITHGDKTMHASDMKSVVSSILKKGPRHPLASILEVYLSSLESQHSHLKHSTNVPSEIVMLFGMCEECRDNFGRFGTSCYTTQCGLSHCLECR